MKKNLLLVILLLQVFSFVKGQTTATVGDYRTTGTGNWNTLSTWQTRSALNTWVAATSLPTSSNNVYIQAGHLITVNAADANCKGLNIFNNANALTISSTFNVNVYDRIRAYQSVTAVVDGTDGTTLYTGTSTGTGLAVMIVTSSTGTLKFVGTSRIITYTNEWGSNGTTNNVEFALDPNNIGTLQAGIKFKNITISSGTLESQAGAFISSGNVAGNKFTIKNGAKFLSSRTGLNKNSIIGFSSTTKCDNITIESGGTMELTGALPAIDCNSFTNNGTVIYSGTTQSLLQPGDSARVYTSAIAITTYNNLTLTGTGTITKTATANTSVSGTLTVGSATTTFDLVANTLDGGTSNTITIANSGTVKTSNTSATPLPVGKAWGGTVQYASATGSQTVVAGSYNNLTLSNTSGSNTLSGTINIAAVFTVGTSTTPNTVTASTVNYNGTTTQSVTPTYYNNLTISNTSATVTLPSGIVYIAGAFNPSTTTTAATGNTLNFNNASGNQIIPRFYYYDLIMSNSSGANTLVNSDTIFINNSFTGGTSTTPNIVTNNTVKYNKLTGGQTVSATYYNNLVIGNTSGITTLASSGIIDINGSFSPGSLGYTINGSTIFFSKSTGAQFIPKFNYFNLTVGATAGYNTTLIADTIGVAGTFTPGAGTFTVPIGNTFNFNSTAATPGQTIPGFNYYNIIFKNINATTYNTLAADINVKNSLTLAGKKGLTPGAFKVIYDPAATLYFTGTATDTIYNSSPQWPDVNGPTNVTLNNTVSATLVFYWKASPADTFRVISLSTVRTGTGTSVGTVTTSTTHNLVAGDVISIGGLSNSELGSYFGGTFTVQAPITATTFTVTVNYDTTLSVSGVVGGVARKNIERTIPGTLSLFNNGKLSVNFGNILRFANGATIFRNDATATIYNNNGFLAMGSTSTDRVNVTIANTMLSDNEFSFFAAPGKYGKLKILNPASGGTSTYSPAGSRTVVDIENYGILQLPQTTSSNLYLYGSLSGPGTISGYDSATIRILGTNTGSLGKLIFTPGKEKLYSLIMSRVAGASVYLGSSLTIKQLLDLSYGTVIDSGYVITVNGSISGTSSGTHISTGSGKIVMNALSTTNRALKIGSFTLGNLEIAAGSGTVYDSTSFTVAKDLTLTSGNYVTSPNTSYITTVQGNLLGTGTASGPGKIRMTGTSKIITGVTVDSLEIAQYSSIKAAANFNVNKGLLLYGNFFDSTFTVTNAGIINGINSAVHSGSGRIRMTGTDKSILGNPQLMNIEVLSPGSLTNGFSASVFGTLYMNGGNVNVNSGNTLFFKNNSTIFRSSGDLSNVGTGATYYGIAATDFINVVINGNLISTNELPGSHAGIMDLTINSGFNYTLKSNNKLVRNFNASNGHLLSLFDTLTKSPYNLTVTNQATISGDFYLDSATYDYPGNSSGPFKVGPTLTISSTGKLKFGNVNSKKLYANGLLTLESRKTGTAYVADVTNGGFNSGNDILGTVTVERFVSNIKDLAMDTGRTVKAWRLLAPPTKHNFHTIKQAWQEGGSLNSNPKPGFGTQLTSNRTTWSADGFDMFSAGGPSIKYFNPLDSTWVGITSTNEAFVPGRAYMVFVRGSRAKTSFSDTPDTTVLREKGALNVGDVTVAVGTRANQFVSLANPYACAIDFQSLTKSNLSSFVWLYDPRLSSYGGYQVVAPDGTLVPGGGSYSNGNSSIQSSQGFFVRTTSGVGSVTFKETSKVEGSAITARAGSMIRAFTSNLLKYNNGTNELIDGVMHIIDDNANNSIDDLDAVKFGNFGENIGIKKSDKLFTIESRQPFAETDTIFYQLGQMKLATYRLQFSSSNLPLENLQPYLEDNFLQTSTPLSVSGATDYDFTVTNVAGSYASDRFRIVFRPMVALPLNFISVSAIVKDKNVLVDWKVGNEINIKNYVVERSSDANSFVQAGNKNAIGSSSIVDYNFTDESPVVGQSFYRIKSLGIDGEIKYSRTVSVNIERPATCLSVNPNPIGKERRFTLKNDNLTPGRYDIVLYDMSGRKVFAAVWLKTEDNSTISVQLPEALSPGKYSLCINDQKSRVCESILIE